MVVSRRLRMRQRSRVDETLEVGSNEGDGLASETVDFSQEMSTGEDVAERCERTKVVLEEGGKLGLRKKDVQMPVIELNLTPPLVVDITASQQLEHVGKDLDSDWPLSLESKGGKDRERADKGERLYSPDKGESTTGTQRKRRQRRPVGRLFMGKVADTGTRSTTKRPLMTPKERREHHGKMDGMHNEPAADETKRRKKNKPPISKVPKLDRVVEVKLPTRETGESRALLDELQYVLDGVNEQEPVDVQKSSMLSLARSVMSPLTCKMLIAQGAMNNVLGGVLGLSLKSTREDVRLCGALVTYVVARNSKNARCFTEKVTTALLQLVRKSMLLKETRTLGCDETVKEEVRKILEEERGDEDVGRGTGDEDGGWRTRKSSEGDRRWENKNNVVDADLNSGGLLLLCLGKILESCEKCRDIIRDTQGIALIISLVRNLFAQGVFSSEKSAVDVTTLMKLTTTTRLLHILELCVYRSETNQEYILHKSPWLIEDVLPALKQSKSETQTSPVDNALRISVLKLLINLTNENRAASNHFGRSGGVLIVLDLVVNELFGRTSNFDTRILSLCLLVNVTDAADTIRGTMRDYYVDYRTNSVIFQPQTTNDQQRGAIEFLFDMMHKIWKNPNESSVIEMECKVTVAYLCLLLGCLMKHSPENAEALRCLLPNRSLSLFREVLAEFLEFHQEAGIFWEAMDEAYTSIIDVFRDN